MRRAGASRGGPDLLEKPLIQVVLPAFPLALLSCLNTSLPVGERRVHKGHIGVNRLLGEYLGSLPRALLLVGQLLSHLSVVLRLGAKIVDDAIEEVLCQLGIEFLNRDSALSHRLIG